MSPDLRERLVKRLQLLATNKLHYVDELLTHLECGDSSPLSVTSKLGSAGNTAEEQRLAAAITSASKNGGNGPHCKDWPHAPLHRLGDHGTYIVTAGTLHKQHYFRDTERLDLLESALLRLAKELGWHLEAWAVFSNHYHFVAHPPAGASNLRVLVKRLHGATSHDLNHLDCTPGRAVWHNFWDTQLTFEKSYLARLNYVHQNPVKHGLVPVANHYRWCSAAWFERTATPAQVGTIYSFKTDRVRVHDDFEVL